MNYTGPITPQLAPDIDDAGAHRQRTRKTLFAALGAAVVVAGGGYYAYDALFAAKHADTDNAYVGADVAQVTPQIIASVASVAVADAQMVRRGDVLVRLDDTDARLALAKAEAAVGLAERKVRGIAATDQGLGAEVAARGADQAKAAAQLTAARSDLAKASVDLARRRTLLASGSVSGDEVTSAQNALTTAQANVATAQAAIQLASASRASAVGTRAANAALLDGTSLHDNPEVAAARAARDQAAVDLSRTVIRAPIDGVVARRQVQVGQRVQPGATLMTVVPIASAYVDANFKEVQLARVRPGMPATLTSDLYGSKVVYHGRVVGFSGGTGAAFAVVPAQNATGNWIKVVQRLPVRISLDPRELADHPLRVGLSMSADIKLTR